MLHFANRNHAIIISIYRHDNPVLVIIDVEILSSLLYQISIDDHMINKAFNLNFCKIHYQFLINSLVNQFCIAKLIRDYLLLGHNWPLFRCKKLLYSELTNMIQPIPQSGDISYSIHPCKDRQFQSNFCYTKSQIQLRGWHN